MTALVGRVDERRALADLIGDAIGGRAGTVLVSGEAGVGKTALVRHGVDRRTDEVDLLWAACLPLTSVAIPFLPLTSALRELAGATPGGPVEFDALLDRLCDHRPVVLVVDDLHWADRSTLDVLMYVIAGREGRRLAVLATIRSDEVGPGHPLRRWLADVRRLPGVRELTLGRLDRPATEQQLAGLIGDPPHQSLVDDVFARTRGNAYLTTLLARDLPPDATALPAGLPTDLREAVGRAWHALSAPAGELTRLLAVAGRPQRAELLGAAAGRTGVIADLREAIDRGVLELVAGDRYWFVHPLLAEVLEADLLPEERQAGHARFATLLERDEPRDVVRMIELADHHDRAGHAEPACRWALRGAEAAERAGGAAESLRLLRRVVELAPRVPGLEISRVELLVRLRDAAGRAGAQPEELAAVEDLLALVDPEREPLVAAELYVRRMMLRLSTGRGFADLSDVRTALRLAASDPASMQYALATAELAHAELWHGEPAGPERAREAVRLARACGSPKALTYALTARAMAHCMAGDGGGLAEAQEAQAAAAATQDFWAFAHATLWWANCLDVQTSPEVLDHLYRSRETLVAMGAPHTHLARMSVVAAGGLLMRGDWRGCVERLREALGSNPGPMPDVDARLTAAMLNSRQGRLAEAQAHLARAEELFHDLGTYAQFNFPVVRAELALAADDPETAVAVALAGAAEPVSPSMAERLIPLAAQAMADQAQRVRDEGGDSAPVLARLADLGHRYPEVIVESAVGAQYQAEVRAMQVWYDAELCRGRRDPAAGTAWQRAATAFRDAHLAWDEAYAQWRVAEALLPGRSSRDAATAALRRAYHLAEDLQALPLLARIEALARASRVPLTTGSAGEPVDGPAPAGLTAREREILRHIVAGRTYREIARALVVSEKTVSVHVSNMLRKTGTANRIELSELARRLTGER
jgi:DNA-binding CsgD family transcriptional regulator